MGCRQLACAAACLFAQTLALTFAGCSPFSGYHDDEGDSGQKEQANSSEDAGGDDASLLADADVAADGGNESADASMPPNDTVPETTCTVKGKGTSKVPCLVRNCAELQAIGMHPTGVYALANDIDCKKFGAQDESGFLPIGSQDSPFTGELQGRGHLIRDLGITREASDMVGLFGLTRGATLSSFGVRALHIVGRNYVGGVVGSAKDGTLLSRVYASGNIDADNYVGGLVGDMIESRIEDAYGLVSVNASSSNTEYSDGQIAGRILQGSSVARCYGQSQSDWILPSLVGDADDIDSHIESCFFDCSGWGGGLCNQYERNELTSIALTIPERFAYNGWDYATPIWGERTDRTRPCLAWENGCSKHTVGKTQLEGDGTDSEPFEIHTCADLQAMNLDLDAIYSVENDVDCAGFDFGDGYGFFPVGEIHRGFSGELRGNNHTVRGLRIFRRGMSAVGLFGSTSMGASIHDLRVEDAVVLGDYDVGVIVGLGEKGSTVSRCRAQGLMSTVMLSSDGSGVVGNPIGTKESDNIDQTVTAQASPL